MSKFSDNLRELRIEKQLTQKQLASRLYVTKQAVSKWERGKGYPDTTSLPLIAKNLDVSIDTLMGGKAQVNSKIKKNKVVAVSFILLFIIFIFTVSFVGGKDNEYNNFANYLEESLIIDFPSEGELTTSDFEDWIIYGNEIKINKMSYFVFTDEEEIKTFENELIINQIWVKEINRELLNIIPENIIEYTLIGDYYIIYNTNTNRYNSLPETQGDYKYIFLIYQIEHCRLIVFEYNKSYIGGSNEE